ncbi:MAG: LptF/LptG family permease, partial [Bacteroidales bacterium]|nr:LptF/LptG family permease [Bacteroidales bacterium]
MRKLDKFTLKAFIGPFVAILLIVVFILMMQFLWLYIDELVGKGLAFGVIMEFMMWGACTILPMALPLSVLLSSMMVIGQMGENKELMAIKAAGISLGRLIAPLIVTAAIISVGAYFVGNDLVPKAYNEIFTLRDDITRTKGEIKIPPGTFYDGIDGYVLRVEGRNDETGMMYQVQVYDHTSRRGNTSIIIADSALLKISKAKDYLTFSLFNGSNYQETNEMTYRDTSLALSRVDFAREELIIPLKNYSFEKSDSARFSDQAKSMRYAQLAKQKDSLDRHNADAFVKHYARMRGEASFQASKQLDTARRNPALQDYHSDNMWTWDSYDKVRSALDRASSVAERMSGDMLTYNHDIYQSTFYLRRTDVELFKKIAQALACFLMFFIGAPIGAMIKKGGIGMSAIFSMLFFVIYWIVQITGEKMAKDGTWL